VASTNFAKKMSSLFCILQQTEKLNLKKQDFFGRD